VSYSRWPQTGDYVEEPWFECSAADGSIVSTAEDMAAYARVILNRGAAPQGRLLSDRAEPERRSRRLKPERLRTTRLKQLSHSESW
jgi:CubicO group peptidase (beta-lactamase class C family)